MDYPFSLTLEDSPSPADAQFIRERLNDYNRSFAGDDNHRGLAVFARDKAGEIIAGLLGGTYWDWLHVDILWVDQQRRGFGLGRALEEHFTLAYADSL